jgi:hypothetical protein
MMLGHRSYIARGSIRINMPSGMFVRTWNAIAELSAIKLLSTAMKQKNMANTIPRHIFAPSIRARELGRDFQERRRIRM